MKKKTKNLVLVIILLLVMIGVTLIFLSIFKGASPGQQPGLSGVFANLKAGLG